MTKGKGGAPVFHLSIVRGVGRKEGIREILELGNCHNYFWSVNVLTMISRGIRSITS